MRSLKPDEIECRVNIIKDTGLSLLLYKNARTDMNILDEAYPDRWACEYREIKGNLFCGISVLLNNEWVTRWDCGVESREDGNGNEKKGEASDSFKRAGTKWGIGRELYTAPKLIWIKAGDFSSFDNKGKKATYDTFSVTNIGIKDGNITALTIANDKTQRVVYVLGTGLKPTKQTPPVNQELFEVSKVLEDWCNAIPPIFTQKEWQSAQEAIKTKDVERIKKGIAIAIAKAEAMDKAQTQPSIF